MADSADQPGLANATAGQTDTLNVELNAESFQCVVCVEVIVGQILQCSEGHIICHSCIQRLRSRPRVCPTCRQMYPGGAPVRNRMLEAILAKVREDTSGNWAQLSSPSDPQVALDIGPSIHLEQGAPHVPETIGASQGTGLFWEPPSSASMYNISALDDESNYSEDSTFRARALNRLMHRNLFEDGESNNSFHRERIREILATPVRDFYNHSGLGQRIARHRYFRMLNSVVVVAYMLSLALDALDVPLSSIFVVYFSSELLVRLAAFRRKSNAMWDIPFCVDFIIFLSMLAEQIVSWNYAAGNFTGGHVLACRLRILQTAMVYRLLWMLPSGIRGNLKSMATGLGMARGRLISIILLWLFITFVGGLALANATKDSDVGQKYFGSTSAAIYTLIMHGMFLDNIAGVSGALANASSSAVVIFFGVIVVTFMLCFLAVHACAEDVSRAAATEKETVAVSRGARQLQEFVHDFDVRSESVGKREFMAMLDHPSIIRTLHELGVDVVGLVDLADLIFHDYDELGFDDLLSILMSFRKENSSTARGMMDLRLQMHRFEEHWTSAISRVEQKLGRLTNPRLPGGLR